MTIEPDAAAGLRHVFVRGLTVQAHLGVHAHEKTQPQRVVIGIDPQCGAGFLPGEVAEMVRYAVGYQSRAFITFGKPIPLRGYDADSRRDVMSLAHLTRETIGGLYKVLPTAVVAAAMRPSIGRRELEDRAQAIVDALASAGGNLAVRSGRQAVDEGTEPLADRNILYVERGGRFRLTGRFVIRF